MGRFITIIICVIGLVCCTPKIINQQTQPSIQTSEYVLYKTTFDSICVVENISNDLDDWYSIWFVDYETNTPIKEYGYTVCDSADIDCIYKLIIMNDSIYNYTKIKFNK